jgi:hypothetical protein
MAAAPDNAPIAPTKRKFDTTALITTASWGIGAAAALFLAVLASLTDYGARRMTAAVSIPTGKSVPTATAQKSAALQVPLPKPVAVTHIKLPPQPQPLQLAQLQPPPQPQTTQAQAKVEPKPEPSVETRRLQEQVRVLLADQDRLVKRLSALERNLDDVTGSIRRQQTELKEEIAARTAAPAPVPAGPVSTVSWPAIVTAITTSGPWPDPATDDMPEVTASIPRQTPLPLLRPAESTDANDKPAAEVSPAQAGAPPETKQAAAPPPAPAKRIAHGIDLGGADSVSRLRVLWRGLQANEAMLLKGLRPVAFMSGTRRGRPDVRLIAGPIANAGEAAKVCSALLAAGRYCEPTVYTGHRLSSR